MHAAIRRPRAIFSRCAACRRCMVSQMSAELSPLPQVAMQAEAVARTASGYNQELERIEQLQAVRSSLMLLVYPANSCAQN